MPIYNKLVRNRIPKTISESEKISVCRNLSQEEAKYNSQKMGLGGTTNVR